jgi:hypothetical protein
MGKAKGLVWGDPIFVINSLAFQLVLAINDWNHPK